MEQLQWDTLGGCLLQNSSLVRAQTKAKISLSKGKNYLRLLYLRWVPLQPGCTKRGSTNHQLQLCMEHGLTDGLMKRKLEAAAQEGQTVDTQAVESGSSRVRTHLEAEF